MAASQLENDRPVDPKAGWRPIAAVDIADEIRVRVAPAQHGVIRAHHRQPRVGIFEREEGRLGDVDSVIGEALL